MYIILEQKVNKNSDEIRTPPRALCAPRELRSENLFELLSLLFFMHNCLVFICNLK